MTDQHIQPDTAWAAVKRRDRRNDYAMIMGIAIYSIIGVAIAVFIMDLLYPLFDPRVRYQ